MRSPRASRPSPEGRLPAYSIGVLLLVLLVQSHGGTRGEEPEELDEDTPTVGYACSKYPNCNSKPNSSIGSPPKKCETHKEEMTHKVPL